MDSRGVLSHSKIHLNQKMGFETQYIFFQRHELGTVTNSEPLELKQKVMRKLGLLQLLKLELWTKNNFKVISSSFSFKSQAWSVCEVQPALAAPPYAF